MIRYLILNLIFIVSVILFAIARRRRFHGAAGYVMKMTVFLLVLTLVFDNIIILLDIVAYDPRYLLGLYAYKAPVEDFMYTLAAVLLIAALWPEPDHA